ncbi:MAG: FecR domain-containing protein [Kiritimatiellae bacterium]|nr:FecR domain-containing protein [Kiritimatiellia bacterium]
MSEDTQRLAYLTEGYLEGSLAPSERTELNRRLKRSRKDTAFFLEQVNLSNVLGELNRAGTFFEATRDRVLGAMTHEQARMWVPDSAGKPQMPARRADRPVARRPAPRQAGTGRHGGLAGAAPPAPPRRAIFAWCRTAAAAAILVALGLLLNKQFDLLPPPAAAAVIAQVRQLRGRCTLRTAGGELDIRRTSPARRGDIVLTQGADSAAEVSLPDGTRFDLQADAGLTLGASPPLAGRQWPVKDRHRFHLTTGRMEADVVKRPAGEPVVIATSHAEIFVLGTRFVVAAMPDATRVDMRDGQVEVVCRANARSATLSSGAHALIGETIHIVEAPIVHVPRPAALGPLALYTFTEGLGVLVHDVSGVGQPLNLLIADPTAVHWLPGGGLAVDRPTTIASQEPARKIAEACRRTHALTVELWIQPGHIIQPVRAITKGYYPLRIVTMSAGPGACNFCVGQGYDVAASRYVGRLRTTETGRGGEPQFYTPAGSVRIRPTHLVFTRRANGMLGVYVDARAQALTDHKLDQQARARNAVPGDFSNWDPTMALTVANVTSHDRPWLGTLYRVAIYDRALAPAEIARNYQAGFGPKPLATGRQPAP